MMGQRVRMTHWVVAVVAFVCFDMNRDVQADDGTTDANDRAERPSKVDFQNQVLPILETKCFSCHGPMRQKGSLRLDQRVFLLNGGHSGIPLLADDWKNGELYFRLTTDDESVRMPLDDELTADELKILLGWLAQGAHYGLASHDPSPQSPREKGDAAESYGWLDSPIAKGIEHVRPVLVATLLTMIVVLLIERAKKKHRRGNESSTGQDIAHSSNESIEPRGLARIPRSAYLLALGLLLFAGVVSFLFNSRQEVIRQRDELRAKVNHYKQQLNRQLNTDSGKPVVYDPGFPKTLGGTWYRGNDERSPRLFNNGYYRTAEMVVSLVNSDGKVIQRGDLISEDSLQVAVEIHRSKNAAPSFFREHIMGGAYLCEKLPDDESDVDREKIAFFDVLEAGETWVAFYTLSMPDQRAATMATPREGTIYLYKGVHGRKVRDSKRDMPHYAIAYSLKLADGKLTDDSYLSMGSAFHTRNVVFPLKGKIPVNEWFAAAPIPEITGTNSDDPKLLGITPSTASDRETEAPFERQTGP